MEWKIRLEARTGWGEVTTYEIGVLRRDPGDLTSNSVGTALPKARRCWPSCSSGSCRPRLTSTSSAQGSVPTA